MWRTLSAWRRTITNDKTWFKNMVTDILLNITSQLLTMGLPSIDESLDKLLVAMETFPKSAVLGDTVGLALCVGSYECWMMMLGRRAMDVMKLLRIVGLSICITYSSWICQELAWPGKALEATTKQMASSKNKEVAALELKVAQKQSDYLKRLRQVQDSIETAKQVQEIGEDAHWWDKLIYNMENLGSTINNYAQRAIVAAETKVSEWINDVIRFIGELIWHFGGATYLHDDIGDLRAHHVCPVHRTAMEQCVVAMDQQIPFLIALGICYLYVPVLHRLQSDV